MSESGAAAAIRAVLLSAAFLAAASFARAADAPPKAPAVSPEVKAAMTKAEGGDTGELVKLADAGAADAQYYAGTLFLFGRPGVARDAACGCGYEQKASATRGDAMHLVGQCYQFGLGGDADAAKAKAAYQRAIDMGFFQSKCVLGQMLLAEGKPAADRGLTLCKEAATAGDAEAQTLVGDIYFRGDAVKGDHKEARRWYEMAAAQKQAQASLKLGEMYAKGDGGRSDKKKAVELWKAAEAAGNPLACILVADQLFSDITGGRTPGPGKFGFRGGIPVADIDVIIDWYKEALKRDPRPDVQERAKTGISVLETFKAAAAATR